MVVVAFDFQFFFEFCLIVVGIVGEFDHVFVSMEFEVIDFIQLAVLIKSVRLQCGFVELFDLRIQPVIVKGIRSAGLVFHIQVHELRAQPHHLVDAFDEIKGHFVTETQTFTHMLVQCDGTLSTPLAFAAFQLDLVILLLVFTR